MSALTSVGRSLLDTEMEMESINAEIRALFRAGWEAPDSVEHSLALWNGSRSLSATASAFPRFPKCRPFSLS